MIIGEKSCFAVEWDVVSTFDNFVYGHFRFWIEGEPIGDWNEEAVLGVLIHSATVFLKFKGKRHLAAAECMNSEQLWCYVDRYSHSDDPVEMKIALEGNYRARFLVHEIADDSVATVCKIILVDQMNGDQRLLWKYNGSASVREIRCSKLVVDGVIEEFIRRADREL
jgi:hypothetical protein